MKFLFSLYKQKVEYSKTKNINSKFICEQLVETDLCLDDILTYLNLNGYYDYAFYFCGNFVFCDVFYQGDVLKEVLPNIQSIPQSSNKWSSNYIFYRYTNNDGRKIAIRSSDPKILVFEYTEMRQGIGGNDFFIIFVYPFIVNILTSIIPFKRFFKNIGDIYEKRITFRFKKFYKNLSRALNMTVDNIHIISADLEREKYRLIVRTNNNDCYSVFSHKNGTIISLHLTGNARNKPISPF